MTDLLWSDPSPLPGLTPSKRGVACQFGPDITDAFLKNNNLGFVIRSHEMKEEGYEVEHDGKLVRALSVLLVLFLPFFLPVPYEAFLNPISEVLLPGHVLE